MLRLFALKYVFSKKNTKAINVISWVSIAAIVVGTAALIIVLSVFNGIEEFVKKQYTNFYTDVSISPVMGKTFVPDAAFMQSLKSNKNVQAYSTILQESVLATHNDKQAFITMRGVDSNYAHITNFNKCVLYGDTNIFNDYSKQLILGQSLCGTLQVSEQSLEPIVVYAFNKDANLSLAPQDVVKEAPMYVTGVFGVQQEFDSKYGITSLHNMRELLDMPDAISSIELQLNSKADAIDFVKQIGPDLKSYKLQALTKLEQNKTLYYVLQSEKWMVYAVMSLLLLIASFNMIGSLSMLVLEKQRDISLLKALGAKQSLVQNIFLSTGLSIALIGALLGCLLAFIVCLIQLKWGVFKMGGGNLLINAYPVKMLLPDFLLVLFTVFVIGFLASYIPSVKASKQKTLVGLK
jgi:lipoprotein-releasing system permease protein